MPPRKTGHDQPNDVTVGCAADWTIAQLRELAYDGQAASRLAHIPTGAAAATGRSIQENSGGLNINRNTPWPNRQAVRKCEATSEIWGAHRLAAAEAFSARGARSEMSVGHCEHLSSNKSVRLSDLNDAFMLTQQITDAER